MAKPPAIGQRSILAVSIEDWLEVILKSGNFRTAGLPGATKYGWLGEGSTSNGRELGSAFPWVAENRHWSWHRER
jgi:hypothetical protein